MDARFRVSPSSFFQTNSAGAAVLYKTIAEKCGFFKMDNAVEAVDADLVAAISERDLEECASEGSGEPEMKIRKLENVVRFLNNLKKK